MKNIDYKMVRADNPVRMNSKFPDFTVHHPVFIKYSEHNVQYTNSQKWQYIVDLFEEESPMTRNNSEVDPALKG